MEKTKSALPSYLGLYNETLSAYTKAVLSTNTLLLGYTAVAVRTILQPVPTPVAKSAGESDAALTASALVAAAEAITVPEIPEPVDSEATLADPTLEAPQPRARPARKKTSGPGRRRKR